MDKTLLRTYVRSVLTKEKQTIEEITKKIQNKFPEDNKITNGRVEIILNQLYNSGLCGSTRFLGQEPRSFFDITK